MREKDSRKNEDIPNDIGFVMFISLYQENEVKKDAFLKFVKEMEAVISFMTNRKILPLKEVSFYSTSNGKLKKLYSDFLKSLYEDTEEN